MIKLKWEIETLIVTVLYFNMPLSISHRVTRKSVKKYKQIYLIEVFL